MEWLGQVPEHWEVSRLRFICEVNPRKSETSTLEADTIVSFLPMDAIGEDGSLNLEQEKTLGDVLTGYTYFREGDVTLAKITPCFENGKGAIMSGLTNGIGFGTTELIVARPQAQKTTARLLQYLFRSRVFRSLGEAHMYGAGGQKRVSDEFIREYRAGIPPLAEQTAIADFLDQETAKIDELITEQERLIELLKEKRQAVISHAVTKGLNPDAPMKDSGIEWIGLVPEHWEVFRLKAVTSFTTSGPRGWSERVGVEGQLFIQSGDLNDSMQVLFSICKRVLVEDDAEASRTRLLAGDVVVCITGAKTGNVAVCTFVPEPSFVNQHLCLIRPNQKVMSMFLGIQMKSDLGQTHFELSQYGLKQGLSLEDVRETPVLLPPIQEQQDIISHLERSLAALDTLTAEAQKAISLLQERRSALISAAVTGQIDVRGIQHQESA